MVLKGSSSTPGRSSGNCTAEVTDRTRTRAINDVLPSQLPKLADYYQITGNKHSSCLRRSGLHFPDRLLSLQDLKSKRNPRLVPYVLLDERTKKSNRDSLREAIRTLIGYGYNIEPSDQEGGESRALSSQYAWLKLLVV